MPPLEKDEINQKVATYLRSLGFQRMAYEEKVPVGRHITGVADVVVFDDNNSPYIVVEIKANLPSSLGRFHSSIDQAFPYVEALNAKYLLITDSVKWFWYEVERDQESSRLLPMGTPPILEDFKPEGIALNTAFKTPDDWKALIWKLHDELRSLFNRKDSFKLITELLYIKLLDEKSKSAGRAHQFQVFSQEPAEQTKSRILNLIRNESTSSGYSIEALNLSNLDSALLQKLVLKLQPYKLQGVGSINVSDDSFYLPSASMGQHFTPRSIINAVTGMFDFSSYNRILDPAAGTGGFLTAAIDFYKQNQTQNKSEIPEIVGFESDRSAALIARTNLLLNGIQDFTIFERDFLSENNVSEENKFDFVVTSLPFGSKIKTTEEHKLPEQLKGKISRLNVEGLYLIQIISVLDDGKFAAVLVPDQLLANTRHKDLREYILSQSYIRAVISLSDSAFSPLSAIKTSILIFQKKGKGILSSAILMMRVDDIENSSKKQSDDQKNLNIAVKTYRHFAERGELYEEGRLKLNAILVNEIAARNAYRLDFSAYNSEYFKFIEKLERGPYRLVNLGDVAEVRTGKRLTRTEEGILLISAANISDGDLSIEPKKYTSQFNVSDKDYVRPGDLLVPGIGRKFPVAIVPKSFPNAIPDDTLNIISIKNNSNIYLEFLLAVFKHEMVKVQLDYLSIGASVKRVTASLLRDIRIPIPSLDEQHEVVEKMRNANRYAMLAKAELEAAQLMVNKALTLE